jgi:hypothetical protein
MKQFDELTFDAVQCRREVDELGEFLASKAELDERCDIQPFFRQRPQLCSLIGSYAPDVFPADRIAFEFPIYGDFVADVVVGNSQQHSVCMIEFEDAKKESIFCTVKGKSTKEWSRRFERGFSQLVDWFRLLSDLKNTERFADDFGTGHCRFYGFLLIGRSQFLDGRDRSRLRWRSEKVVVDSHTIHCLAFDDLFDHLSWRIRHYSDPSSLE